MNSEKIWRYGINSMSHDRGRAQNRYCILKCSSSEKMPCEMVGPVRVFANAVMVLHNARPSSTPWRPGPIAISISLKSSIIGPSLPFTDINDSMVSTRRPLPRSVGVFAFAGKGSLSARRALDAERAVPKCSAPPASFRFGTRGGRPRNSNSPSSGRWVYGRNCKQRYLVTMNLQRLCKLGPGALPLWV